MDEGCADWLKRPGLPTVGGWGRYWQALQRCDNWWNRSTSSEFSVLAPNRSWRSTIGKLQHLVRRDWSDLDYSDQARLLGLLRGNEENWALLGNMRAAHPAVFQKRATRRDIEDAVKDVLQADDADFPTVAILAFQRIQRHANVGHGVATRLLTAARPDRILPLNGGSEKRLAMYSGLPRGTLDQADNYKKLLHFIYRRPWFRTPVTDLRSDLEKEVWSMRAALLDSFVYTRKRHEG